ncbi:MAG: PAS domain-containing sensor histidine kinase, partial [Dehalococcoidia bacterium]
PAPWRWAIVCIDVDDRRRAQEELRASEEQMRAMLDAAAEGVIVMGEDRIIRSFNRSAERMFGYAAEEVIGRDVSQLMPSPMREEHDSYVRRYLETGERRIIGVGREVEARRKDGSTFPIQLSISEVKLAEERIFTGILHDLTQRKRAEDRQRMLAEATEAFNASLDVRETLMRIPSIVAPTLADCCIVFGFDPGGQPRALGIACDDPATEQKAWQSVTQYPPDLSKPFGLARALATGESDLYTEFEKHWEDVSTHPGQLGFIRDLTPRSYAVVALKTPHGIAGALTLVSYHTHRRFDETDLSYFEELARRASAAIENARLYADSQRTSEELRQASAAKDEFLGLVSHELRTPITTIYGNARLLRSRAAIVAAEDRDVALADVEHEAERLQRIIENLLVLARMETAETVEMEPIEVGKTVRRIAAEFCRRHLGTKIELSLDERARVVIAQPTYFELVLHNFLSNAAKYGAPGEPVEVEATAAGDEVEFRVLDYGAGVRPEEIERLFSPFYRAKETRTLVGGMGIGLAVCKRLLEAQGARVWARPRPGGGAEFGFALSAKLAPAVEEQLADVASVGE